MTSRRRDSPTGNRRVPPRVRHLVVVLGDQLDESSTALEGIEPGSDVVWMAEVTGESTQVWSHQARIALFLTAMRHFQDTLRRRGWRVDYRELDDPGNRQSLGEELVAAIERFQPDKVVVAEPGEWRVEQMLRETAARTGVKLEIRPDRHFLCSRAEFTQHAQGRKQLRLEFFYREMRRRHGVLMEGDGPAGGAWNLDAENRESFGREGPTDLHTPVGFSPDELTREVLAMVQRKFADHPGSLAHFDWPVTPVQAREALTDFLHHRLPNFGRYQDAMWMTGVPAGGGGIEGDLPLAYAEPKARKETGRRGRVGAEDRRPYLFHSRLSAALNLKLLDPREVIAGAEAAYREGRAPLASVEGFIRQILGWREYVRGVYWHFMPGYGQLNALGAEAALPAFYWTGDTDLRCLREVIGQTLAYGYAHHIQRLMVTGLFGLLLGVQPAAMHAWYLAMYVDAVEWVELPNTLGMSQFADGGLMASKPYVATGKYVQRMSNYCTGCPYHPGEATGPRACPFTVLYWDFLMRHQARLQANPRMTMQLRNLARLSASRKAEIREAATAWRAKLAAG